ncbi:hypothetical protein OE88DRAFT_1647017 [Heliocybe sulcata]|uniref:Uncharacterized protein n=1 Tax=Heliocybe sulcata TaxID=5364 RepID=A0A5C3MUG4_9AGAM|nr:hypothetical protein OE88DRAFT_1647017 [Heliocybe sulcata]
MEGYDLDTAKLKIKTWSQNLQDKEDIKWKMLANVPNSPDRIRLGTILRTNPLNPKMQILTYHADEDGSYEEVSMRTHKKQYLKQSVQLTGLSTETWESVTEGISIIHRHMSRSFKDGMMLPWMHSEYQGYTCMDIPCRYFTAQRHLDPSSGIAFDKQVDPRGVLTRLQDDTWFHTADNVVNYYSVTEIGDQNAMYTRVNPAIFRIGDIVEVELAFMAIPTGDSCKLGLLLRAVALLDCSLSDAAAAQSRRDNPEKIRDIPRQITIKWSTRPEEDPEVHTRCQLARLDIRYNEPEEMET